MRNHKAAILATVCAAVLAINLDTTIVNVALPSISREVSASTRSSSGSSTATTWRSPGWCWRPARCRTGSAAGPL